MDFLRRLLGLSSNSSAVAHPDEVSITHQADAEAARPPEPVIRDAACRQNLIRLMLSEAVKPAGESQNRDRV